MTKKFEPTFESLRTFKTPEWFRDAKFGIWSHWGPQSVPMFGDWYARNMYVQGSAQYNYHIRHYGHPSKFGYKDICELWKAENFDPDALMEKYYKAGARYFVAQATHHDHFFGYDSKINRFNSVNIGPKKDICQLWYDAAKKYNLPFGITEHLAASYNWWRVNKDSDKTGPYKGVPYDGNDPAYKDFYYEHEEEETEPGGRYSWHTKNEKFREYWLSCVKEMIDKFTPELLYSDGGIPFATASAPGIYIPADEPGDPAFEKGLQAIAYLYNKSIEANGENMAIYTQKDRRPEVYNVGILDIEKSQLPDIRPEPWQTDTCIGNWFYDVHHSYKSPGHIIEILIDVMSKNGTMLLNILQRPDGSIDDEANFILDELAKWFEIASDAVYGTRPWRVSSEGVAKASTRDWSEDRTAWTEADFRFVQKDEALYAFIMKAPEKRVCVIKSLTNGERVDKVTLLGYGEVEFTHSFGILTVKLPENLPTEYVNALKIEGEGLVI